MLQILSKDGRTIPFESIETGDVAYAPHFSLGKDSRNKALFVSFCEDEIWPTSIEEVKVVLNGEDSLKIAIDNLSEEMHTLLA